MTTRLTKHFVLALILLFFQGCGKSDPPSPLYQTQSSKIQKEIQKRKEK